MLRKKNLFWFLSPAILVVALIYVIPIANTFRSSFYDYFGGSPTFVGLANYGRVGEFFGPLLWRTVIWTFGSVIPALILGLAAALLFQDEFRGKRGVMTLVLLPYTMPLVIVATLWMLMYNPSFGFINVLLRRLGLIEQPIDFLSYHNAMAGVIVARIWRAMPFAFISYYAGLQAIPQQLYEAARVDGANRLQTFCHITLPQLRSVTVTTGLVLTVWTALVFDIIYAMTGGGPIDATRILPVEIYKQMFAIGDIGVTSALSVCTVGVLLIFSVIYWQFVEEEDLR